MRCPLSRSILPPFLLRFQEEEREFRNTILSSRGRRSAAPGAEEGGEKEWPFLHACYLNVRHRKRRAVAAAAAAAAAAITFRGRSHPSTPSSSFSPGESLPGELSSLAIGGGDGGEGGACGGGRGGRVRNVQFSVCVCVCVGNVDTRGGREKCVLSSFLVLLLFFCFHFRDCCCCCCCCCCCLLRL